MPFKCGDFVWYVAVKGPKIDPRIQRTKMALQTALIDLILERGYAELSVQHIIERAGTSRSTFYAHYRDKADLLAGSIGNLGKGLMDYWKAEVAAGKPKGQLLFVAAFLSHINPNRRLWRALNVGESGEILRRHFKIIFGDLVRRDLGVRAGSKAEATVACVVGALMGLMEEWMEDRISGTPEEMNRVLLELVLPGLRTEIK